MEKKTEIDQAKGAQDTANLKEDTLELIGSLTTHGIPNLFKTRYFSIRLLWGFISTASAALCIYFMAESITYYLNFDVVTKVRIVNAYSLEFPKITICNQYMFTTDYAISFLDEALRFQNISPDLASFFEALSMNSVAAQMADTASQGGFTGGQYVILDRNFSHIDKKKISFSFDEILLSCTYAYGACTAADWSYYYHGRFGNCYEFNSGINATTGGSAAIKQATRASKMDGLIVELFVGVPNELEQFTTGFAAIVKILNHTTSPYDLEGIEVAGGMETSIAISKKVISQQPVPYSECEYMEGDSAQAFDSDLYRMIVESNYTYYQMYCIEMCFQKLAMAKCKCFQPDLPVLDLNIETNYDVCHTYEEQACGGIFYTMEYTQPGFIDQNCRPLCPLECNRIEYETSIRLSDYPSLAYAKTLAKNPLVYSKYANSTWTTMNESLARSVLKLNVFYKQLSQEEISESPSMDFFTLLSQVGGMSIISLFEFVEIILQALFITHENKKGKLNKINGI